MQGGLLLLVLVIHVGVALLDEKLHCLILTTPNGIVEWRLSIFIDWVRVGLVDVHEPSHNLQMTLSASVEQWCLYIGVSVVHKAALLNQDLNQVQLAFTAGIVECSLIQRIYCRGVNTIRNKIFHHLNAPSFFFDKASIEDRVVIVLLVVQEGKNERSIAIAEALALGPYSLEVSLFDSIQDCFRQMRRDIEYLAARSNI